MASKPENTFIQSVHRKLRLLSPSMHYEKMFNPFRSGTADVWYSSITLDIWIEYKYLSTLPVRSKISLDLSGRQKEWLRNRFHEGRNVAVICGCKLGGVVFQSLEWEEPIDVAEFKTRLVSRDDLAAWIINPTTGAGHAITKRTFESS